jgi:hypothetical protein
MESVQSISGILSVAVINGCDTCRAKVEYQAFQCLETSFGLVTRFIGPLNIQLVTTHYNHYHKQLSVFSHLLGDGFQRLMLSDSGRTFSESDDHLTPGSSAHLCIQLVLPSDSNSRTGLTSDCQPPVLF